MSDASTVLVLGARGRLGAAVTRAFAQAGWQVVAQVRPGAASLPVIPGVRWVAALPWETEALAAAAGRAPVVVQALSPAYTHPAWRRDWPRLAGAGIAISRRLGATLMLPGNVYNYGHGMPALLREETSQAADTVKGRIRVQLERQLAEATVDGTMRAVVLRAGDFYGGGTGTLLDLVVAKALAQGRVTWPAQRLDVATPWAYLPDLARAFVAVARRRDGLAPFDTLHFAGHAATGADWVAALTAAAREAGWLAPDGALRVAHLPWPLLRLAGLAVPTLAAVSEMRYLWQTPHRLDDSRLRVLTGPLPATPFAQAVREAVAALGLASPTPAAARAAV